MASKLEAQVALLRTQHRKLQLRNVELEKKAAAGAQDAASRPKDHLLTCLGKTAASLLNTTRFSDINVLVAPAGPPDGEWPSPPAIPCHKIVLASRGVWTSGSLDDLAEITLDGVNYDTALAMFRWVYTDHLEQVDPADEAQIDAAVDLLRAAVKYDLVTLKLRCEENLTSSVTVANSVRLLNIANELDAGTLKQFTKDVIRDNWEDIEPSAFALLEAGLLYELVKNKTEFPLHCAIELGREDVVFMYLLEFDMELSMKINGKDANGHSPLHLALLHTHESIASTLVTHGCDVDDDFEDGTFKLLHAAISRRDTFAACFLIDNSANINAVAKNGQVPLHLAADNALVDVLKKLIDFGANVNVQDGDGNTAMQTSIVAGHAEIVDIFLETPDVDVNLRNAAGHTALWLALGLPEQHVAKSLVDRGCDINLCTSSGDSMLHHAVKTSNERATLFLLDNGANPKLSNDQRETALHLAASLDLHTVVPKLIEAGASLNAQDKELRTPLMRAIISKSGSTVNYLLAEKDRLEINLLDSTGQCALGMALEADDLQTAAALLASGAHMDSMSPDGLTLLQQSITRTDDKSALFLMDNGANVQTKSGDGRNALQLAIEHGVDAVIGPLCNHGADVNAPDESGTTPLWLALRLKKASVARILVEHKCNVNEIGDGGFAALHMALRNGDEFSAIFLIKHGAQVNTACSDEHLVPIHLAADLGMTTVMDELLKKNANVNQIDSKKRTAIHRAVLASKNDVAKLILKHPKLNLKLRDHEDRTAFGLAIATKNLELAQSIKQKDSTAADLPDSKGMALLHIAITESDEESVKLLLKCNANVNFPVQDQASRIPLAMAVERGLDKIVKALLGAGADHRVPDRLSRWTVAHVAASLGFVPILKMLIQSKANMNAADDLGDTVLHSAVRSGHKDIVQLLLEKTNVTLDVVNHQGESALHTLAAYPADGSIGILQMLFRRIQGTINPQDAAGNTPLLLAYKNQAAKLCKAFISNGGHPGIPNGQGQTIFDLPAPSKKLLYRLLVLIPQELPWMEMKHCQVSGQKFNASHRRHHCRHCARSVSKKHSGHQALIPKFQNTKSKPVRTCEECFKVLSGEVSAMLAAEESPSRASRGSQPASPIKRGAPPPPPGQDAPQGRQQRSAPQQHADRPTQSPDAQPRASQSPGGASRETPQQRRSETRQKPGGGRDDNPFANSSPAPAERSQQSSSQRPNQPDAVTPRRQQQQQQQQQQADHPFQPSDAQPRASQPQQQQQPAASANPFGAGAGMRQQQQQQQQQQGGPPPKELSVGGSGALPSWASNQGKQQMPSWASGSDDL